MSVKQPFSLRKLESLENTGTKNRPSARAIEGEEEEVPEYDTEIQENEEEASEQPFDPFEPQEEEQTYQEEQSEPVESTVKTILAQRKKNGRRLPQLRRQMIRMGYL